MPTSRGLRLAAVGELDLDVVGAFDDMVVGDQVALGRDDDAGAEAALRLVLRAALAEEEAEPRVVGLRAGARLTLLATMLTTAGAARWAATR